MTNSILHHVSAPHESHTLYNLVLILIVAFTVTVVSSAFRVVMDLIETGYRHFKKPKANVAQRPPRHTPEDEIS